MVLEKVCYVICRGYDPCKDKCMGARYTQLQGYRATYSVTTNIQGHIQCNFGQQVTHRARALPGNCECGQTKVQEQGSDPVPNAARLPEAETTKIPCMRFV